MEKIKLILNQLTKQKQGFSLSEVIVAISILTILATITATQFDGVLAAARDANRLANMKQVHTALNLYFLDNEVYPKCTSSEATSDCYQVLKQTLEPMYMPDVPLDPLNQNTYTFKYVSDGTFARLEYNTEDPLDPSPRSLVGNF